MKFLATLLTVFALLSPKANAKTVLTLHERNTLVLRNVIDDLSVAQLQNEAIKMSNNLSPNETIVVFLDSPGGSISAGNKLISTLNALPQRVVTVTSFAASMAFITAESLGTRYITPEGTLMSHRAFGGTEGQIPGELNVRVKFFTDLINEQNAKIAARVGMSFSNYNRLIHDEYWISGEDAVRAKMADRVVYVRCDKELAEGKTSEQLMTMFGNVELTYSDCPIIAAPLEVNFSGLNLSEYNDTDKQNLIQVRKAVLNLVNNKREFYNNYILTNKYKQLFQ